MTGEELEKYRDKLLALRDRLDTDVAQLSSEALRQTGGEAAGSLSNTPLHLADLGSDTFAENVTLGILEKERQALQEVGDALARITQGTFGRCESCHGGITRERLQALPYARFCVNCAQKVEEDQASSPPPGAPPAG
jgi:RNA polymerase-binding transcription factor DksA